MTPRSRPIAGSLLHLLVAAAIGVAIAPESSGMAVAVTGDRSAGARDGKPADDKTHKHVWVKQTRKEWVPPETKRVKVGVDAKGNPIYETQIVKPGYWKTTTYQSCSCGATIG